MRILEGWEDVERDDSEVSWDWGRDWESVLIFGGMIIKLELFLIKLIFKRKSFFTEIERRKILNSWIKSQRFLWEGIFGSRLTKIFLFKICCFRKKNFFKYFFSLDSLEIRASQSAYFTRLCRSFSFSPIKCFLNLGQLKKNEKIFFSNWFLLEKISLTRLRVQMGQSIVFFMNKNHRVKKIANKRFFEVGGGLLWRWLCFFWPFSWTEKDLFWWRCLTTLKKIPERCQKI